MIWLSPARWLPYIGLAATLFLAQQWRERVVTQREFDRVTGIYAEQALVADRAARDKEQAIATNITKVIENAKLRETKLLADAGRANSALDRLRVSVAASRRSVPGDTASASDSANASGELLVKCAEALVGVSAAADRHASDALMLKESWPK